MSDQNSLTHLELNQTSILKDVPIQKYHPTYGTIIYTHDWNILITNPNDRTTTNSPSQKSGPKGLEKYIEKITFRLPANFKDPVRTISKVPFGIAEEVYTESEIFIGVDFYFKKSKTPQPRSYRYKVLLQPALEPSDKDYRKEVKIKGILNITQKSEVKRKMVIQTPEEEIVPTLKLKKTSELCSTSSEDKLMSNSSKYVISDQLPEKTMEKQNRNDSPANKASSLELKTSGSQSSLDMPRNTLSEDLNLSEEETDTSPVKKNAQELGESKEVIRNTPGKSQKKEMLSESSPGPSVPRHGVNLESGEYFERPECKKDTTEKIYTLAEELTVQRKFQHTLMQDKHALLLKQNESMQEIIDKHKVDKNELLKKHKEELNSLQSRQDKKRHDLGLLHKDEEKKISMQIDESKNKMNSIREEMRIQFQNYF